MRLTKRTIEALEPSAAEAWYPDDDLPGFGVRVLPSGRKSYLLRFRTTAGQMRKLSLGDVRSVPLGVARELAMEALVKVRRGADPAEERRRERMAISMADLWERYSERYARHHKKPSTVRLQHGLWVNHLGPRFGTRLVDSIRSEDVERLHADLGLTPFAANRALMLLSSMLAVATRWGYRTGENPCRSVKRFPERPRERVPTRAELARFGEAVDACERDRSVVWQVTALVRILLLTGARKREIMHARWEWVDLEAGILRLPDSKVGPCTITLVPQAVDILRGLPSFGTSEWVIPGDAEGKPFQQTWRGWARLRERAGLPWLRIHDLRHVFGTLADAAGLSTKQIAMLLNHRKLATTARYVNAMEEVRAESAARAAEVVVRLTGGA